MDEPLSTQASAGEVAEQRESYERLYEQMSRLESVQADAIWMRFFGRLKYREIAELAGVSLATAKNRVRCGLERLAKLLCEES